MTQKRAKESQQSQSDSNEEDDASPSSSDDGDSEYTQNETNKNKKRKTPKKKTPTKKKKKSNNKSSRRVSVSTSQSQRSRRSQSQSQLAAVEEEEEFTLVQHNERVMEMYSFVYILSFAICNRSFFYFIFASEWLTSSQSWTEIKKTLQKWVRDESNCQDGENYMELTLDIVNLMLYVKSIYF